MFKLYCMNERSDIHLHQKKKQQDDGRVTKKKWENNKGNQETEVVFTL